MGHALTIVTTDKRIPITVCHSSIDVFLRLLESDVHVSVEA